MSRRLPATDAEKAVGCLAGLFVLIYLALFGVIIWGIITLVLHFT